MSVHIAAQSGQIAPDVLMPGDPLRAKWIADNYLDQVECYNQIRGMLGFTGVVRSGPAAGRRVSVQGSGMGMPSFSIYCTELLASYDVKRIIRVGSCGAIRPDVQVRDLVIAMTASTDSSMNHVRFEGWDFAPCADFGLLAAAVAAAGRIDGAGATHVGGILSSDTFYESRPEIRERMADHGVLAVEMEASALYSIAPRFGARALAVCTVSDHVLTGDQVPSAERENTFGQMVEVALAALAGSGDEPSTHASTNPSPKPDGVNR